MLLSEFQSLVYFYTGANTTTFTAANMLLVTNAQMELMANRINKANPAYFGRVLTRDLVAGERRYSLPSDILSSIAKVEVALDGVKWKDLDPLEISTHECATDETSILREFDGRPSKYYVYGQNVVIMSGVPIIDVDEGIRFFCNLFPTKLTNFTDVRDIAVPFNDTSQGFPRQMHEILARAVGIVWKQNQDRPIALTDFEVNIERDIVIAMDALQAVVEATPARENVDNWFEY